MSESKQSSSGSPKAAPPAPTPDAKKKRLLLIEDENAARIVLLQKLRAAGFYVDTAPNGRVALEKLRDSKPDAIFMDMLLPEIKGVDVIKEARRTKGFGNRPIFVCTSAANMEAWTKRGTKAGATKVFDRGATSIDTIVAAVATDIIGPGAGAPAAPEPQAKGEPEAAPELPPVPPPTAKPTVAGPLPPPPTPSPAPYVFKESALSESLHPSSPSIFKRALKVFGLAKNDERPAAHDGPGTLSAPEKANVLKSAPISAPNRQPTGAPALATPAPAAPALAAPVASVTPPSNPTSNPVKQGVSSSETTVMPFPSVGQGGAVLTLDPAGKIISADEGCVAMFGWEAAMLVDVDLKVLIKEGLEQGVDTFLRRHRGGDASKAGGPVIARRRDGTEFRVSVTTLTWSSETTLTRKSDGGRACWTAVFRDWTSVAQPPPKAAAAAQPPSPGTAQPPSEDMSRLQQSHVTLQKSNADLQKQVQELSSQAATHRDALAQSQKEREEWQRRIHVKEMELNAARAASERETRERKQLEQKLQALSAKGPAGHSASPAAPAPLLEHLAQAQSAVEREREGVAFHQEIAGAHRLGEELAKLRQSRDELTSKLTTEQQALAQSQQRSEELESRLSEVASELECLRADNSEERESLESALREQLGEAQKAAAQAESNHKKEAARNLELEKRLQVLGNNLKAEQNERSKRFEQELASLRQERDQLNDRLAAEQQATAESKRRADELEDRLRDNSTEFARAKGELDKQLSEQRRSEAEWRKQLETAQALSRKLERACAEAVERNSRFEGEMAQLQQQRDELQNKLADEQQAAAEPKRRVEELENHLRENATELVRVKTQLQTVRSDKDAEMELVSLEQVRDALSAKLTAERWVTSEATKRSQELEAQLHANSAELERVKTERDSQAEVHARLEADLRGQLDSTKNAVEQVAAALTEKAAKCNLLQTELAGLQQLHDELSGNLATEQQAAAESRKRSQDLDGRLRESAQELERYKAEREKQAEQQARLDAELQAQLAAAKAATELVETDLKREKVRCSRFEDELVSVQKERRQLRDKLDAAQQAESAAKHRIRQLEDQVREREAGIASVKLEFQSQSAERGRTESDLRAQLEAAKSAAQKADTARQEQAAQRGRVEGELAGLRNEHEELGAKWRAEQRAVEESRRRMAELERNLGEKVAEVQRAQSSLESQSAERGRLESDLRAQLEAAKSAAQKADTAREEQAAQRSRLDEELAGLRRKHEELDAKWKAEQRAVEESRRRIAELERTVGERASELQRTQATFENQSVERGRLESELRTQLEAAKSAAQKAEAARQEQTTQHGRLQEELNALRKNHGEVAAKCTTAQGAAEESKRRIAELEKSLRESATELQRAKAALDSQATEQTAQRARLEKELAGLRKKHDDLGAKGKTDQKAVEDSRRRIADFEKELREKATELQRTKTAFENQAAERGRTESDLRSQLEAAKSAAQKADAARQEQTAQRGRLQEELNALRKGHEEIAARCKTEQSSAEASKRRVAELEKSLADTAAELQRTKTAMETQAAERARQVPPPPKPSGNTEAMTKELCRLREDEAVRNAELADLRRQMREGVGSSSRLTADLEKERAERRRIEQRTAALTAQLQELHDGNKQHLSSADAAQKRILDLEQQLREREDSVTRVSADLQKEASSRHLAEEQLRSTADLNGHLRNCLSSFEVAKKGFKRMQEELEARQKANLAALKETEVKLQAEVSERKRIEEALAAVQRSFDEQSQQSSLELAKLQSELQVEKFEQKRLQGEAIQSRYSSLDSARVGHAMVNSFRKQIQPPVDHLMQSTRRLLESQLEGEQKKLVESLLEDTLLLRSSLQESGSADVGGERPGQGPPKVEPARPPGLLPQREKPNLQP